jgi:THO complex subunit 2
VRRSELDNQKLWVLFGLVKLNAWNTVKALTQIMPVYARVHPPLARALCEFLEWLIDPVYQQVSPRKHFKTTISLKFPQGHKVQATTVSEAISDVYEVLSVLGLSVSESPLLYVKICRLAGLVENTELVYDLIKHYLLPALNSRCMFLANDLWRLIKDIPSDTRYDFYAAWRTYDVDPYTLASQATAIKETRAWIKRLSNENARKEGRTLCKLIFNNPALVYEECLFQVMNYFNFASAVVTSLHNLSPLVLDILPFSLISFIKSRSAPKLDDELGGVATWINNIAAFTGMFYSKEPAVELMSVLEYIGVCMSRGEVVEICIFKEILNKMSGWDPPDSLTGKMIASLGGGTKLKLEIMHLLEMKRISKRSSTALMKNLAKPLKQGSLNTAIALAMLVGVHSERFMMTADTEHLKILGTLYDKLVDAFFLVIDILSLHYDTPETYSVGIQQVKLSSLVLDHHLSRPLAVSLCRRALELLTLEAVCEEFKEIYPECGVSLEFYTLFWMLGLQDVTSLTSIYNQELQLLDQEQSSKRKILERTSNDLKITKELVRIQKSIDDLKREAVTVTSKCEASSELIKQRASEFLRASSHKDLISGLAQHCFFPRIMSSMPDSLYCAKFIELMQRLKVVGFCTMDLVYELITTIIPCVYCCTEREAGNIGLFFLTLFKTLGRWKDNFNQECLNSPGFEPSVTLKHFEDKLKFFHGRLAVTLGKCFSSTSYMQQRNALIVLTKLVPVFPTTNSMANQIMKNLTKLKESELDDLKLMATRYSDSLLVKFKAPVVAPVAATVVVPAVEAAPVRPVKRRRSPSPMERSRRRTDSYSGRHRSKYN